MFIFIPVMLNISVPPRLPYPPDSSGRGKKKTKTDRLKTNQWRSQQKNKLSTTSAHCVLVYMHSVNQCTQSQIKPIKLLPFPAADDQTLYIHRYPIHRGQTYSIYRFGDQCETRKLSIYKEKWETEDPKQCWLCIWLFRENLGKGSSN